jgi:hypothetical protein
MVGFGHSFIRYSNLFRISNFPLRISRGAGYAAFFIVAPALTPPIVIEYVPASVTSLY